MIENRAKRIIREGGVAVGVTILEWVRPSIAKLMALAGFDFLFLEYEHVYINEETMANIILASRAEGIPSVVKVPSLHRHFISRALDAGALGIQLPHTETREEAKRLVDYIKYPPVGDRAVITGLANTYYESSPLEEYLRQANEEILAIAHVETARGIENLDEILSVPGLDVLFIGPGDLSVSLGVPGQSRHPRLVSAVEGAIEKARSRGVAAGIYVGTPDDGRFWMERGMQLLETVSDLSMVLEKGSEVMAGFRRAIQEAKR